MGQTQTGNKGASGNPNQRNRSSTESADDGPNTELFVGATQNEYGFVIHGDIKYVIEAQGGGRMRDRYVTERNIGLGAFGVVDLAKDRETGKLVALKSFRADSIAKMTAARGGTDVDREGVQKRLWEEVSLQSQCQHPNILLVLEWFRNGNRLEGFALEYCHGGSLKENLENFNEIGERLSEEFIARWMSHILSALEHIHSLCVAHLDVKLDNFLVDHPKTNVLKLSDFGLAAYLPKGKKSKLRLGTPFYMAPEIVSGIGYSHKVDCWSAGVVYLYLLEASIGLINNAQLQQQTFPPLADIRWRDKGPPVDALRLLEGLLTQSPVARYSARRGLANPWIEKCAHNFQGYTCGKLSPNASPGTSKSTSLASGQMSLPSYASGQMSLPSYPSSFPSKKSRDFSPRLRQFLAQDPLSGILESGNETPRRNGKESEPSSPRETPRRKSSKDKASPRPTSSPSELEGHASDMQKIRYMMNIFDQSGTERLVLSSLQDLFAAANPSYYNTNNKFPSEKMFKHIAKNPKEGMSADEICEFISGTPGYISRLTRKIVKWEKLSESERESRRMLKLKKVLEEERKAQPVGWG